MSGSKRQHGPAERAVGTQPAIKLHHTHLMASDIDATIAFWVECFGAEVVADTAMAGVRNVLLDIGGGRLNLYAQPPNHRGVVNHLGVHVADIGAVVSRLEAAGWEPRPIKADGPLQYAMIQGPDELLLEVFRFDPETTEPALRPYFDLPAPQALPQIRSVSGAGELSSQAIQRLAKPPPNPVRPPNHLNRADVERWRQEIHAAWLDGDPLPIDLDHHERSIGGVRCLQTTATEDGPLVVYFHGGGFVLGSPEVAIPITDRIANSGIGGNRIEVVSVAYRLAPEHPYPAAVDDGLAVVLALAEDEQHRSITLAGDSAGANIAVAVANILTDEVALSGLVLLSPHLDLNRGAQGTEGPSDPTSDVDDVFGSWLADRYRGSLAIDDPRVSPLLADLGSLPKTLVQVGSRDSTFTDAIRFGRVARLAGVDVTLDVWHGLWHTWHYHRDLPEADQALREVNDFVSRLTH